MELKNLKSQFLAKRFLKAKAEYQGIDINDSLVSEKARGLSYCIRNTFDYLDQGQTLASRALSTYYACFSLLCSIVLSDTSNHINLQSIDKASTHGHGLRTSMDLDSSFPDSMLVYFTNRGFLYDFQAWNKIDMKSYIGGFGEKADKSKLNTMTMKQLFGKVPSLGSLFHEVFDEQPYLLRTDVYENQIGFEFEAEEYRNKGIIDAAEEIKRRFDYISDWQYVDKGVFGIHLCGTIDRELEPSVPLYYYRKIKDSRFIDYIIDEMLDGFFDPLLLNFCLLYMISILVRYKPYLWRKIMEGELDQFRYLIETYISIAQKDLFYFAEKRIEGIDNARLPRRLSVILKENSK